MSVPYTEATALATWAKAREIAQQAVTAAPPPTWDTVTGKPNIVASGATATAARAAIGAASTTDVQAAVNNLVAAAPAALDTLNELATALGNDPNFATTITNALATKLDKSRFLEGTGSPEGAQAAPVGTYYTDRVGAAGAWGWQKRSGVGMTGWVAVDADTGLRNVEALTEGGFVLRDASGALLRRVGPKVTLSIIADTQPWRSGDVALRLPAGFRPNPIAQYLSRGDYYGSGVNLAWVAAPSTGGTTALTLYASTITAVTRWSWSWDTLDAWPTTLPGTAV